MKNINKIGLTVILSVFLVEYSKAQESFTLESAIEYALDNHSSVKNASLDYEISKDKVKETTAIGLPQISGKWDIMHNINIQKQFLPANAFNPSAPSDMVVPVKFGVDYSSNANITATQLLFDGSYLVGLKAAKTFTELYEQSINQTKTQIIENVSKSYYLLLITNERTKQLNENLALLKKMQEETSIMNEAGFVENIDVKRVQVNVNNLSVEIQKLESLKKISENLLKFNMGYPIQQDILISETFENLENSYLKTETNSFDLNNRPEYQIMMVQEELSELDLKNEKIRLLPSLGAFYTIGYNYATNKNSDVFKFNDYQNYSVVGLSLNVPIWSSGQRKFRISQSKLKLEKLQNDKTLLESSIELERLQAQYNYNNSIDVLQARKQNMELANEVFNSVKEKYQQGMASGFELTSTQTDVKTAQTDYFNALYETIVYSIDLKKSNGILLND